VTGLVVVRHGYVEGIDPPRFRGRTDVALSSLGRRQAAATAAAACARWAISAVYASPLRRCLETAGMIAAPAAVDVQVLPQLNDLDYGDWQWMTHDEARAADPGLFERWFKAPDTVRFGNGESLQDLAARAADALRLIVGRQGDATVAVVSHDSVNRIILMQALGLPLSAYWRIEQSPCGISEVEIEADRFRVLRVNETGHVEGLEPF
jgi:phosphoserine phosphatase